MYAKYIDGSLIQLLQARYTRTDPQILTTYHVPLTDINGAIPLGLDWQTWTISGVIADPMSIRWRDIIWLSLDNVAWRACRVQATAFPTNLYHQSLYELTVLVSPILEGAAVRYPTTGYLWGLQSISGLSQAGNVPAFPAIHYLAPLFYAPLSNTLIDFAGQSVTFTRTASKVHAGVTYPVNVPIFDSGLYLASDTARDVATWTPPASTVRTVAMQIKSRYPSLWLIGTGNPTNLITNGNFETDTTGWVAFGYGSLSRETAAPLAGMGSAKMTCSNLDMYLAISSPITGIVIGHKYLLVASVKAPADCVVSWAEDHSVPGFGQAIRCTIPTSLSYFFTAAETSLAPYLRFVGCITGETALADSVVLYDVTAIMPILTVWTAVKNKLTFDLVNNLLKWTDDTTTVSLALPASYLSGTVMDVVLLDDTSHAVTLAVHPVGGAWTSATGTLALLTWPQLTLGNLEGSLANLVEYPYVLTAAEYQALAYSGLSLLFNTLYVGNRYAGEIVKGSDKRLVNANGSDISALLGGSDIAIGATPVTITQSQGLSARWYVELKRTDV